MNAEQKKRIMKRYLMEKSKTPIEAILGDDALIPYAALDRLLDYIEHSNQDLFDVTSLETDPKQWKRLVDIIDYATRFTPGSPPVLISVNEQNANFGIQYWRNARDIRQLPRDDYYTRQTNTQTTLDTELQQQITESRAKLYALLQTVPNTNTLNPADITQVQSQINNLLGQIEALPDNNPQKFTLVKHFNILVDLNKINQLQQINIPQDNGSELKYCILAESMGGVTEKVSLISLSTAKTQLTNLCAKNELSIDNYNAARNDYKLSTDAIIKLPKHGNIKEVQHEAMALNISRIMGLDTTSSTTISHNGQPALFVPFDNIKLLSEFSSGKTFTAGLGITGQTYTHYSTITPVGAGIQADRFVDDFGDALALLYLCSDTDAIGGYCQNKALKDSKSLFIFDQVIMNENKFILDSRLSLQPDQFIMKHTRHGQGRNRTLIEDSTMVSKFASIMHLRDTDNKIIQYANHTSLKHHQRANVIKQSLRSVLSTEARTKLTAELKEVELLATDAEKIRDKIQERIKDINDVLPKTTGNISYDELRQALIVEKLIHNPVLFSDDGRPYKNPWTTRQTNNVESITDLGNGSVQLRFKSKVPAEMISFIRRRSGANTMTNSSAKVISMSREDLNALSEDVLHPEHRLSLEPNTDYLAIADLLIIKSAYDEGHKTRIINLISSYRATMNNPAKLPTEKLATISKTETELKELILSAKDKGMGMHVLKKFHFDAQQQLQKLMNPAYIPANINQAFSAALKLDRVSEFNHTVQEALVQNKLSNPHFSEFLNSCIQRAAQATNHSEAKEQSKALANEAYDVTQRLQQTAKPLIVQLGGTTTDAEPISETGNEMQTEDKNKTPPSHKIEVIIDEEETHQKGINAGNRL